MAEAADVDAQGHDFFVCRIRFSAPVVRDDVCTLSCEAEGDSTADSAGSSRDSTYLPLEEAGTHGRGLGLRVDGGSRRGFGSSGLVHFHSSVLRRVGVGGAGSVEIRRVWGTEFHGAFADWFGVGFDYLHGAGAVGGSFDCAVVGVAGR